MGEEKYLRRWGRLEERMTFALVTVNTDGSLGDDEFLEIFMTVEEGRDLTTAQRSASEEYEVALSNLSYSSRLYRGTVRNQSVIHETRQRHIFNCVRELKYSHVA